jgi:hypothetical protein
MQILIGGLHSVQSNWKYGMNFNLYSLGFILPINYSFPPPQGLDDREFESREGMEIFLFTTASRLALGPPHPPIQWSTRGSFPGGKAVGVWSWPLISIWCRDQECSEVYLHLPNTPSWRGAQLKHRDKFTSRLYLLGAFQVSSMTHTHTHTHTHTNTFYLNFYGNHKQDKCSDLNLLTVYNQLHVKKPPLKWCWLLSWLEISRILYKKFITTFTRVHHPSLSWVRRNQSISSHSISLISILILFSHLQLDVASDVHLYGFPITILYQFIITRIFATCPTYLILGDLIPLIKFGKHYKWFTSSSCNFLNLIDHSFRSKYSPSALCSQIPWIIWNKGWN